MLAKSARLNAEKDYSRLFSKGRAFHARGIIMKVMKSKAEATKVGFVVSTKVAKKANVRNLVKRRMREIIRKHYAQIERGLDIAFKAKVEAKSMEFAEVEKSMLELLWKAGILPRT